MICLLQNITRCHYKVVQFVMISYVALQWQQQSRMQTSNSQKGNPYLTLTMQTPRNLPVLGHLPVKMSLKCSIQNSTCPGQFSSCPAQNALALASRRALLSLNALIWGVFCEFKIWCVLNLSMFSEMYISVLLISFHMGKLVSVFMVQNGIWYISYHKYWCQFLHME